jgi:hypothetical protein
MRRALSESEAVAAATTDADAVDAGDVLRGDEAVPPAPGPTLPTSTILPLVFLPAIIIVGHEWQIAATTWDGDSGRTVLWTGPSIGNTKTMIDIYRIIWCVRRLARYAAERYWPWFAENILGLRYEGRKESELDDVDR